MNFFCSGGGSCLVNTSGSFFCVLFDALRPRDFDLDFGETDDFLFLLGWVVAMSEVSGVRFPTSPSSWLWSGRRGSVSGRGGREAKLRESFELSCGRSAAESMAKYEVSCRCRVDAVWTGAGGAESLAMVREREWETCSGKLSMKSALQ